MSGTVLFSSWKNKTNRSSKHKLQGKEKVKWRRRLRELRGKMKGDFSPLLPLHQNLLPVLQWYLSTADTHIQACSCCSKTQCIPSCSCLHLCTSRRRPSGRIWKWTALRCDWRAPWITMLLPKKLTAILRPRGNMSQTAILTANWGSIPCCAPLLLSQTSICPQKTVATINGTEHGRDHRLPSCFFNGRPDG